jgi:hypothetical protein
LGKEEKEEIKNQTAKDVAAAMVENMKKNMEDPDFLDKKEKRLDEVTKEVLKRSEEKNKKHEEG